MSNMQTTAMRDMDRKEKFFSRQKQKNELSGMEHPTYLQKTKRIGSYDHQTYRVNYPANQKVFSVEVPETKQKAIAEMKYLVDRNKLGTKKAEWNTSSSTVLHYPEMGKALFEIKKGLLEQKCQTLNEKSIPEGTETRDTYTGWHGEWQASNKAPGPLEKAKLISKFTDMCVEESRKQNEEILETKHHLKPHERTKHYNHSLRKQKATEKRLHHEMWDTVMKEDPGATKERAAAMVFRKMYEEKVENYKLEMNVAEKKITGKPDLTKTLVGDKTKHYYHNGKWEENQFEKKEMWSCCLNEKQDCPGCLYIIKDKKAWNLAS